MIETKIEKTGTRLLTSAEAAEMLRVPLKTLERWRQLGRPEAPPCIRQGKYVMYRLSDIEAHLAARVQPGGRR